MRSGQGLAYRAALACVAAAVLSGCATPPGLPEPTPAGDAAKTLKSLKIADPDDHGHDYDRDDFGEPWADVDDNGCDTRDDILRRDLTGERFRDDHCTVVSGTLRDRYTGDVIHFRRGRSTSLAVQIDHVFPLHAAWLHGAWKWSAAKREKIANDPGNLLAVDGKANNTKSDGTPSEWRPRHAEWCDYATRYVDVAGSYHLTITHADERSLAGMLATCP